MRDCVTECPCSHTGDDDDVDDAESWERTSGCKRNWLAVTEERFSVFCHFGFKATTRASMNYTESICKQVVLTAMCNYYL